MANGENDEEKDKVLLWLPCHGCTCRCVDWQPADHRQSIQFASCWCFCKSGCEKFSQLLMSCQIFRESGCSGEDPSARIHLFANFGTHSNCTDHGLTISIYWSQEYGPSSWASTRSCDCSVPQQMVFFLSTPRSCGDAELVSSKCVDD